MLRAAQRRLLLAGMVAVVAAAPRAQQTPAAPPAQGAGETLSLEELLDAPVVTASGHEERLGDAPATVIVITGQEIRRRGYTELSQILDDLPGMQMSRPHGETYFKNYWRGFRNAIGDPFLVMRDGVIFNHLYYNSADILSAFPLSDIERVEIVYGPASSVYGANASMGVINIITVDEKSGGGERTRVLAAGGGFKSRIVDASYFHQAGDFRFSLSARADFGENTPGTQNDYEYTSDKYFADRRLWGGFVDNPALGGRFDSPHRIWAIDGRLRWRELELAAQYFWLDTGNGTEYAADRVQNRAVWARPELSLHARIRHSFSDALNGSTLLRYRTSGVDPSSNFLESYNDAGGRRVVDYSYWQALDDSWTFSQDFDWRLSEADSLSAGVRFERKNLQKAYDIAYGPAVAAATADPATYPFPRPGGGVPIAQNRIITEDAGIYLQNVWRPAAGQQINLGVRRDHNSQYGTAITWRGGYVGSFGRWGVKALYGEAFQEPPPRLLYGGWRGSGSDPMLRPERSRTYEAGLNRGGERLSVQLSAWQVNVRDTLVNEAGGARNLGAREMAGADLYGQAVLLPRTNASLRLWGAASRLLRAREETRDALGNALGEVRIGDLADTQLHAGLTAQWGSHCTATLRGRWISARPTFASNPAGSVPAHATADFAFTGENLGAPGLGLLLAVNNLGDAHYADPGTRDANAGFTPGQFTPSGYSGSAGFYNSLLPQPGRSVLLALRLDF